MRREPKTSAGLTQEESSKQLADAYRKEGWNDALHEVVTELLDGVAGHNWFAREIILKVNRLKKEGE